MTKASHGYFDAASAEPLHPAAHTALVQAFNVGYADPRRLHGPARNARIVLDNARAAVAEALEVRPDEVTFTPSGTHAVHLGVLGLLERRPTGPAGPATSGKFPRLLAAAVEHSSVMHAGDWHARRGGSFETIPVDSTGQVSSAALSESLSDEEAGTTAGHVVAVQSANHEVGTVQRLSAVSSAISGAVSGARTRLFVDACASGGRLPLPDGWDVAAFSAHKWGGPAGVGVLVVRKGVPWRMPFPSDDRVDERSTGFENVPAAFAAAAALQAVVAERDEVNARHRHLTDRIRARLAALPDVTVLGDSEQRLPHLVAASCLYVDGEALVSELDRRGLSVASGSACTSSTLAPSHVLEAMGVLTHGNLRISLTPETTDDDVDRLLVELPQVIEEIRAEIQW